MVEREASRDSSARSLSPLSAFARTLSHTLRTPLSIISNDLHYLSARDTTGVATTTLGQCRKITAILDLLTTIGSDDRELVDISYQELSSLVAQHGMCASTDSNAAISIVIDHRRFNAIMHLSKALLPPRATYSITLNVANDTVRCILSGSPPTSPVSSNGCIDPHPPERFEAILLEALMNDLGGRCGISPQGGIILTFPGYPR
jgi:signal transduction histidine kinase